MNRSRREFSIAPHIGGKWRRWELNPRNSPAVPDAVGTRAREKSNRPDSFLAVYMEDRIEAGAGSVIPLLEAEERRALEYGPSASASVDRALTGRGGAER